MSEHRADGALGVRDRQLDLDRSALVEHEPTASDELVVEVLVELVILRAEVPARLGLREVGSDEDRREVESGRLPVSDRAVDVEQVAASDDLVERAIPEFGEVLAHLLGDELEEVDDELRLAGEALAKLGVLRGDAHGARVEVADAHHDAALHDQRRRGEAELLGSEERADDDVAARLQLPVDLYDDAVAHAVEHEGLLGLGEPEFPRGAGVLQRVQGARAGAAVVPRDEDDVGERLRDAGGDRADARLAHELHVHACLRVGALEVEDQLLEVFDRVDVVVRRRRDETDAGGRVARASDPRVDLRGRQLAALAGLGALRELDLDVVGMREVHARHAEAARGDLLDRAAPLGVEQAVEVLAAFAGVRLRAEAVHGDRERLVRLFRDRAVAHGAGREALHDRLDRFDLVDRHRGARAGAQREHAAQRHQLFGLRVDE